MSLETERKIFKGANVRTLGEALRLKFAQLQAKLVSGQNIKTINNESLLGEGDISIPEGPEGNGIADIIQTIESNESGGINEVTIVLKDGTQKVFRVKNGGVGGPGPQGDQGNTGVIIDKETFMGTIVNNDTEGGEDKAWSAERGKVLRQDLDELEKLANTHEGWEQVTISYGRAGNYSPSFPNESGSY